MTPKQKSASPRKKPISDARRTAFALLRQIVGAQPIIEHAFADNEHFAELSSRDQEFTRHLVMATLRHMGQADAIIKQRLSKPLPSKYQDVRWVLRLGIVQILWMRVPDHAAVNTSVELVKQLDYQNHAALVNAILSSVARQQDTLLDKQDPRFILPLWMWRNWSEHYGEDKARIMAQSINREPHIDFSIHPHHPEAAATLQEATGGELLATGSVRVRNLPRPVPSLEGYADGTWWVQDASASLPARFFGEAQGKTIIDACAAPGGKTAQLATMGAKVIALDIAPARMMRLRENIARLKLTNIEVVCEDALEWQPDALVDGVLLDAPCSATGTLRRHPEGLWQKKMDDVERLSALQYALLERAIDWLKPDGTLIYATCSLEPQEGEMQITRLLETRRDVVLSPITQREASAQGLPKSWVNKQGTLRILPHYMEEHGGMDGFYIARLKKV